MQRAGADLHAKNCAAKLLPDALTRCCRVGNHSRGRHGRTYCFARVCIGVWGTPPAVTVPPCLPEGAKGVEASRAADRDVGAADRGVPLDESRHPETRGWFLGTVSADCLDA